MIIYTVTLEDNDEIQNATEICWQYCYPSKQLAKAAVLADVYHFREEEKVPRGASVEWRAAENASIVTLEDRGRTWSVFKTQLISP